MTTLHIDYAALEAAAETLVDAGTSLDSVGSSAPGKVDAGDATYIVCGMISQILESAAGLSEGLQAAGEKIRTDTANYRAVDDSARQGLTTPGEGAR